MAVVKVGGKDLGAELLKVGLEWWYKLYAHNRKDYAELETRAREAGVGIWSLPENVRAEKFKRWKKR